MARRSQGARPGGSGPRRGGGERTPGAAARQRPRPVPALLCPPAARLQAHAQSPGSGVARGLSFPGWARPRLSWARQAAGGGGREGEGRRAGGRGRRGAGRASPEGPGARTRGETEQGLPARPAPRRRCRRVSGDPGPGAQAQRAGWGGQRPRRSWENWGPPGPSSAERPGWAGAEAEEGKGPGRPGGAAAGSGPLPGALMAAGLGEGGPGASAFPDAAPRARRGPRGQQVGGREVGCWDAGLLALGPRHRRPFVGD